jgi:predicted GNAT family acetyltransferase
MNIRRFDDPVLFQEKIQEYLVIYEAENNLLLGIINGLIAGEYREREPYMAYVEERGRLSIVIMCTPPHQTIFSYTDSLPADEILELCLKDLIDFLGDDFVGISANKKMATRLKGIWEGMAGRKAEQHMSMRIYKLEELIPPQNIAGSIRPVEKRDRRMMMDWLDGFYREALQESPDPAKIRRQVDLYMGEDSKLRGLMIWEKHGIPVSMAGYAGPTPNGIRVGAVFTPPEQRKRGYASAVTAGVSQYLLDIGYQFCFLFTDLLNPTSNHIYQQIGYKPVCDVDRYTFK